MLINDYKKYLTENNEFINLLKSNKSITYGKLEDALKVLNFICAMNDSQGSIDEDLTVILETGFSYIQDTIETIKLYFNNYFNSNYKEFKKYESIINYLLYLDDITEVLKEKNLYDNKKLDFIGEKLENILKNKLNFDIAITTEFDEAIDECIGNNKNIYTTYEVFLMIAEELQL